jgi:hypothetical protein
MRKGYSVQIITKGNVLLDTPEGHSGVTVPQDLQPLSV